MSELLNEDQLEATVESESDLESSVEEEHVIEAYLETGDYGKPEKYQLLPDGGSPGDVLIREGEKGSKWVTPANRAEEDNTLPITSAAVYVEIGNINALLATI